MDFINKQILPPKHWQSFEDLCLAIFRAVWNDRTAIKNGRSGQHQKGVDIVGQPSDRPNDFDGVQCKLKDRITEKELRAEIDKALGFEPTLGRWILATTAHKDAAIEEIARQITEEHRAKGLFSVQVLAWEDLLGLLAQYPAVIEQFYPEQAPTARQVGARLAQSQLSDDGNKRAQARDRALTALSGFEALSSAKEPVELGIEIDTGEPRPKACSHAELAASLVAGTSTVLEAEPGAGKSTTLLQIARSVADQSPDAIPILIPLRELPGSTAGLLEEISARHPFAPVGLEEMRRLAEAGAVILICDGWNELSQSQRTRLLIQLNAFRRDLPDCGLLVATRALSPLELPNTRRAVLLPLTNGQQLAILKSVAGDDAGDLLVRARRQPDLRRIIRNPFYLRALGALGIGGALPDTKEELLRSLVRSHDAQPSHRDALLSTFNNTHNSYLRHISAAMADRGVESFGMSELRAEIARASTVLIAEHQLTEREAPTTHTALETLLAHHILIEAGDDGEEKLYSFQHHQFQEWYASFFAEQIMLRAHKVGSAEDVGRLDDLLNRPNFKEMILFAVERISRDSEKAEATKTLVQRALHIDLIFAAEIIERLSEKAWAAVAVNTVNFAKNLLKTDQRDRALRFMGMSGRSEFAEDVWPIIFDERRYNQINYSGRGWLRPKCLGAEAKVKLLDADPKVRRILLWDLCVYDEQDGIDFAISVAKDDTDPDVVLAVLEHLEFDGAESETKELLAHLSGDTWKKLASRGRLRAFTGEYRQKLIALKWERANALAGHDRYYALVELAGADEPVDGNELVALALAHKFKDLHQEHAALTYLHEKHPEGLNDALNAKIAAGLEIPYYASRFVTRESDTSQEALLKQARDPSEARPIARMAIARALNEQSASILLKEYLNLAREALPEHGPQRELWQKRRSVLLDTLSGMDANVIARVIVDANVSSPPEISACAEILFRWHDEDRDKEILPLREEEAQALTKAVIAWSGILGSDGQTKRYHASNLASAIKRIGKSDLFPSLMHLLAFELRGLRAQRQAREEWMRTGKRPSSLIDSVSYTPIYRQAFAAFAGEEVRDALLALIGDPDFEVEAAFELRRFGTKRRIDASQTGFGRGKFSGIEEARRDNALAPKVPSAVAIVVLDRIDKLLTFDDIESVGRACDLARAAVQMDSGDRFNTICQVIERSSMPRGNFGLLEVMSFQGIPIRSDWVARGLEDEKKKYFEQKWHNPNDWWVIRRWLDLMALSDDPTKLVAAVKDLPPEGKREHDLHEPLYALGFSDAANATDALIGLAEEVPEIVRKHDWLNSMVHIGTETAARYLKNLALAGHVKDYPARDILGVLLNKHPSVKRELIEELKRGENPQVRYLLAPVFGASLLREDIFDIFDAVTDDGDPLADALEHGIGELAVERVPVKEHANAYDEEPYDLSDIRKKLFQIASEGVPKSRLANRLLMAIERKRDSHGRPPAELRHPDIASGLPFPLDIRELENDADRAVKH